MDYLALAFFMGLFGSLHCVAMCGPLVLAMPAAHTTWWSRLANTAGYHLGRVLVYGVFGLLVGLIGHSIGGQGWQRGLTLVTGALLVGAGVSMVVGKRAQSGSRWQQRALVSLTRWIGYWLYRPGGNLVVGALNGLLPCGMVYMALAAALSAESVAGAGLFMVLFGLGTWPALFAVSIAGQAAKKSLRINLATWLPIICVVMGCWFLLRGANLDIPYLSPLVYPEGAITCK